MRRPGTDKMPRDSVAARTTPEQLLRNIYANSNDSKSLDHQNDQHANRHLKAGPAPGLRTLGRPRRLAALKPPVQPAGHRRHRQHHQERRRPVPVCRAGWRDPDIGEAAAGRVGEGPSKYTPQILEPSPVPRTLLVNSKLEGPDDSGSDKFMNMQGNAYRKGLPEAYVGDKTPYLN